MGRGSWMACVVAVLALAVGGAVWAAANADKGTGASGQTRDTALVMRGRYVVQISGCNDCHTAGYTRAESSVPEGQWLTGDTLGWRGPWGTTYPTNLRLLVSTLSEDQWVQLARTVKARPPMPWWAMREMHEDDLRALYQYIRSLGPAGEPAPMALPPDQKPKGPFVQFPGS